MRKIYIAGKYDDDNVMKVLRNIRSGVKLATKVLQQGDIPFCPFLDCLFVLIGDSEGLTQDHFRDYSMKWLECCDEVWFLPSWINSGGCKAERQRAIELGLIIKFVEEE